MKRSALLAAVAAIGTGAGLAGCGDGSPRSQFAAADASSDTSVGSPCEEACSGEPLYGIPSDAAVEFEASAPDAGDAGKDAEQDAGPGDAQTADVVGGGTDYGIPSDG
jgi:hypothetical protein